MRNFLLVLVSVLAPSLAAQTDLEKCQSEIRDIADRCVAQNKQRTSVACSVVSLMRMARRHKQAEAHANRVCNQLEQHTSVCIAQIDRLCRKCSAGLDETDACHLERFCNLMKNDLEVDTCFMCNTLRTCAGIKLIRKCPKQPVIKKCPSRKRKS